MSSITPSNIAGSIVQGAQQQHHVAQEKDAKDNDKVRKAQQMRKLIEQHLEAVEDSYQTTDDPMTVNDERRRQNNRKSLHGETDEEPGGLDVTA